MLLRISLSISPIQSSTVIPLLKAIISTSQIVQWELTSQTVSLKRLLAHQAYMVIQFT